MTPLSVLSRRRGRLRRCLPAGAVVFFLATVAVGVAAEAWTPPVPPPDDFDWIQLKSGEWLKGRLKGVQERKLEFDSEELDDLTFDLEDVYVVRSGRAVAIRLTDRTEVSGVVEIDRKTVEVVRTESGEATLSYPRVDLQGIAPAGKRERDLWSGKASVGINVRSGNTSSSDATAQADLQRRTPNTRGRLNYLGNFSKIEGVESINNHRVNLIYDIFLGSRLFVRPVQLEYFRDPFQNIRRRTTIGLSAGYNIFDRSDFEWSVTGGPAYLSTAFLTVGEGRDESTSNVSALFTSTLDKELSKRVDLGFSYQFNWSKAEGGGAVHHSVGTLSFELTKALDLDLTLTWDRVSNPQPDAGGVLPKRDDFRFGLLFGLDL